MHLPHLIAEANEQIRVHHASGHVSTAEAAARLVANGLNAEQAAALLTPIEARDVVTIDGSGDTEYHVIAVSRAGTDVYVNQNPYKVGGTWVDIRDVRLKRKAGKEKPA